MKELLKNKKFLISIGVILGLILILVILNFTLFTLQYVEIDFRNQSQIFTDESIQSISNDSAISKGTSIFNVAKKEITQSLEKKYHNLKVINIETIFPNKIIIHIAEREETYAIKAFDQYSKEKYFICDAEFKVLYVSYEQYHNEQYNAIMFTGLENMIVNSDNVIAGDFLEFKPSVDKKILLNIGTSLLINNKTVAMQKSLIKSIEYTSDIYYVTATTMPYLIIKDFNDFQTNIYKIDTLLAEKFQYMFAVWSQVIYNPNVFFNSQDLQEHPEISGTDYYLNYVLEIIENIEGKLLIFPRKKWINSTRTVDIKNYKVYNYKKML